MVASYRNQAHSRTMCEGVMDARSGRTLQWLDAGMMKEEESLKTTKAFCKVIAGPT